MKMQKIDWKGVGRNFLNTWNRKLPEILTGIGISGMVTTTVLAVKATPEAMRRIEAKKKEEGHRKLTPVQTVQAAWTCYILAGVTGSVSIACLIGSSAINGRRNAALATAYSVTEATLRDYRQEVTKALGERKEEAIRAEVDKKHVTEDPPTQEDIDIITRTGKTLCMDGTFGGYFYSDVETIRGAVNHLNGMMKTMTEPYISLNDFNIEIDREPIEAGNFLGWNVDMYGGFGNSEAPIKVLFSSQLIKGIPVLVMTHANMPKYDFDAL